MFEFLTGFALALLTVVPAGVFFVHRRLRRFEKTRREDIAQLEELSKLTGGLAHEIKNPLSTVKVNLKLISEDLEAAAAASEPGRTACSVPPRVLKKVAVLRKETDRLEQILEGFLRYIDRVEPKPITTDLNDLVATMIDFYSPQARSHRITVRQGLSREPLACRVDADMLKQALLNLFINAQQAMDGGGELIVTTARAGDEAIIRISDTGCGIEPDKLDKIFDAYYTSRPHGSGLGLPTAKKIVELHNGSITAQSEPGKGTSFIIRLPLQRQQ